MSKEQWFRHYEALVSEFPEMGDDELSELAEERAKDERADRADYARDLVMDNLIHAGEKT